MKSTQMEKALFLVLMLSLYCTATGQGNVASTAVFYFCSKNSVPSNNMACIIYTAPTGSPSIQSFLITSDTTAELNWQPPPPLEQNGVIVDYSIELCSNRTGSCSRWNTGSNDTFYVLEGEHVPTITSKSQFHLSIIICIHIPTVTVLPCIYTHTHTTLCRINSIHNILCGSGSSN